MEEKMDYTDKAAHDRVVRARTVLLIMQPFFGCLALQLKLVECDEKHPYQFKTMAVDGTHMYYFTEFVKGLTEPQLIGVVAHEVMHCAFQHMTRRKHRNPVIWNMAGDYVINDTIIKAKLELPGKPCTEAPKVPNPNDKTFYYLLDPKYAGMSTEEIYERIKEEVQKQLQKQKGQKGKKGQKGEGGISMPDTDLDLDGLDIDPSGCGGVIDAAGPGQKHENDQVSRDWDANVRMAVNVAKRSNAGSVPGYLERLVQNLEEPRVSWREVTRQFIDQSMAKDYSWARPNRRFIGNGIHLPGFVPDALHHMIFVVDTSGSINDAMLQAMGSEIGGALNDHTADKLTVVYADTEVRHVDEFVPGDLVQCKMHGGGGTCFSDSFRWIKENASDAACIVYLTDMMTSSFGEDLGIPTLWAAYLPHRSLNSIKVPFGTVISVDTSE
jgi:predicted metal-dependent peptidase